MTDIKKSSSKKSSSKSDKIIKTKKIDFHKNVFFSLYTIINKNVLWYNVLYSFTCSFVQ